MANKKYTKTNKKSKPRKKLTTQTLLPLPNIKHLGGLGFILLLTFLAFSPALQNDFTNWDDAAYVLNNPIIYELSFQTIKDMFTTPVVAHYHPLTTLSFSLNYQVSGTTAFGYILTNILLHLLNVVLVFYFTFWLTKGKVWLTRFVALLFAIHPLHVESVVWISERKDVLYTCFFMGALLAYQQYLVKKKTVFYGLTLFLFLGSLLAKSAAVVLPLVLLLLDYWYEKKWDKQLILAKIPFFALALLFGVVNVVIQSEEAIGDLEQFSLFQRFLFVSYGFVMYIVKLFFPIHLSALYPYPDVSKSLPFYFYLAPLGVLGLIALFIRFRQQKVWVFSGLFFLINIILVLQLIPVGDAIMADRYTYLPYIGLFLLLGYGLDSLLKRKRKTLIYLGYGAALFYAISCTYLTFARTKIWKNSLTLWTNVIEQYPDRLPIAYNNRGNYYRENGDTQKAIEDYTKTIALEPTYYRAYGNRGNLYVDQKQYDLALADYTKVLQLKPNSAHAYANRGGIYVEQQQFDNALADFKQALKIDNKHLNTYYKRGFLYLKQKNYQAALTDFDKYIQYNTRNAEAYQGRGVAKHYLQQYQAAVLDYDKAIQLNPTDTQYYLNRSYSYVGLGNKQKALESVLAAQKLGAKVDARYLEELKK